MENKNYYPLRLSSDNKSIITNAKDVYGCATIYSDEGGFEIAGLHYSQDAIDAAKQIIEAYNEKYGPKVKHHINKTYSEPTLDEMIAWCDSVCNGIVITDAEITTHISKALVLMKEYQHLKDSPPGQVFFDENVQYTPEQVQKLMAEQPVHFVNSSIHAFETWWYKVEWIIRKKGFKEKTNCFLTADWFLSGMSVDEAADKYYQLTNTYADKGEDMISSFNKFMENVPKEKLDNMLDKIDNTPRKEIEVKEFMRNQKEAIDVDRKNSDDMIKSFEKYMDNISDDKFDKMLAEINGPIVTDADLIQTALTEGSITVAQSIQLMEVSDTPGFKNLFIQMQHEYKFDQFSYIENQKILNKYAAINTVQEEFEASLNIIQKFISSRVEHKIVEAAQMMIDSLKLGNKLLSCGNGGSYSDAQHFASELSGKYRGFRPAIAAIALSDGGAMSCIANDFGFNHVFERQVHAIGRQGDVLLCLSTSGNSNNVILAASNAQAMGITTVGICGNSGGALKKHLDIMIEVPHSGDAGKIQEISIMIIHILVNLIERGVA